MSLWYSPDDAALFVELDLVAAERDPRALVDLDGAADPLAVDEGAVGAPEVPEPEAVRAEHFHRRGAAR